MSSAELIHIDITKENIPKVDLAISIGVLPYIEDGKKYFNNILPFTKFFLFNYLNGKNYLNIIRKYIKILDVRNYNYHNTISINSILKEYNFKIISIQKLATGFIVGCVMNIYGN